MADIFISYKREDKHLAEDTITRLKEAGYSVWYDERINPQSSWDETIEREIAAAKAVVVLWTQRSVASEWVRTEADYAKEHGKMIPVKLEACSVPLAYRRTQTADLSGWDGNPADRNWQKVLEWVRGLVSGTGVQPGGIGPSVSAGAGGVYSGGRRGGGAGLWIGLVLVLLIGGAGALWATGMIGPEMFAQAPAEETADTALAAADAPEEAAPTRAPEADAALVETAVRAAAPAGFGLWVTADREDPNGHNWDVGPGMLALTRPDIRVTSASHADVRLSCEDTFQCSGGRFANADGRDSVTLLVMDDDDLKPTTCWGRTQLRHPLQ
ncbi:MAG: toll/interleukin-1 receptor domain-containing protein [Hyphomonadaceae bacterium]